MKLRVTAALLVVGMLLVGMAGCGGSSNPTATVLGLIVDDGTLVALAGAVAGIGNAFSPATAGDGRFTLGGAPTGAQTLVIAAPGHQALNLAVNLQAGDNDLGLVYVAPTLNAGNGIIRGRCQTAGALPIAGATIKSGTATARSRADGTGAFSLYNVPFGFAQVTFQDPATGSSAWRTVELTASNWDVTIGTVSLSFGPPPPPL